MKRAAVVLHGGRAEAVALGRRLAQALHDAGVEVRASPEDAELLGPPATSQREDLAADCDLVFGLGGDGTLLRAAQIAWSASVPVLGVNLGRLGFLAELEAADLEEALGRILTDGFDVEERMAMEAIAGERVLWALNDVIVAKPDVGRAVELAVSIGGEPFTGMAADGLIVATPTGSTAYSFSAHGPVVSPDLACLIVTPVSAHGLFDRSIVVPPDQPIALRVLARAGAVLSADGGAGVPLPYGATVTLRRAARPLRLAKVGPTPFWRLLREKFRLPDDPRARTDEE